jgi:hypothetical protein
MKTIILILSIFLATSCNNDDDNLTEQNNQDIVATWNLLRFEQFGPIYNYNNEEIQWIFNSNETVTVEIVDGTEVDSNLLLNNSGIYSYSIENNGIFLDGILYPFEINNNELIILINGGPSVDGEQLTFTKLEE